MSTNPLPPWMIAENFGETTGTPGGPQPMPPGFPAGLWIDLTPPSSPSPPVMSSPPPPTPPNPQVGVSELPPPNTPAPAPLPNPTGEGAGPGVVSPLPGELDYTLGPQVDDYPFPDVYFGEDNWQPGWDRGDTDLIPAPPSMERQFEELGIPVPELEREQRYPSLEVPPEWQRWPGDDWSIISEMRPRTRAPSGVMEFRGRPRRIEEIPTRRDAPPWFEPGFPWPAPRRAPERRTRIPPGIERWGLPPRPLPGEMNPNPPVEVPFELPTVPSPRPSPMAPPDPLRPVPQPEIRPALPVPEVRPLPGTEPIAPSIPAPRPPPTVPRAPQPAAWPRIAQIGVATASILRPILRRNSGVDRAPFEFRDFVTQPVGELVPQPVVPTPQPVAPPATFPDLDLTPLDVRPLPFAAAQPQTRRREEECRCEDETEEEAEERREANASNVIAEVKSFARRMSQNSLDNLKGRFR